MAQDCARQLATNVTNVERDKIRLSSRLDELTMNAKVEMTDACASLVRERGKLEIECRQLRADLAGMDRLEACC